MAKKTKKSRARTKAGVKRTIHCYLCGHSQVVSGKAMSTTCPACHKAIRIEDLIIKTYTPVNDLETCGHIHVTKRGRVAAKRIRAGDGIECQGVMHGAVETPGEVEFGPKAEWKGETLHSEKLIIVDGVKLDGCITVPFKRKGIVEKKTTSPAKKTV